MRSVLLVIGAIMMIGALANAALALHGIWVITQMGAEWGITVGDFIETYEPWFEWTRGFVEGFLPTGVVDFMFGLPALVFFPVRMLIALLIAQACLSGARR